MHGNWTGSSSSSRRRPASAKNCMPRSLCKQLAMSVALIILCVQSVADAFHHTNPAHASMIPRLLVPSRFLLVPRPSIVNHHHWRRRSSRLASTWTTIDWNNIRAPSSDDFLSSLFPTDTSATDTDPYSVASYSDLLPTPSPELPSPVERILVRDRIVYVKRDDLLRLDRSNVSGNKARKFLSLNELSEEKFPDVVVSYGGPQSNAMVALAAIVHSKNDSNGGGAAAGDNGQKTISSSKVVSKDKGKQQGKKKRKRFVYYTKQLPRWLRNQPSGNFLRAMSLGMELVELSPKQYEDMFGGESGGSSTPPPELQPPTASDDDDSSCLWVPQGGACGISRGGGRILAEEIVEFWTRNGKGLPLAVCLPGGTCSTALLLHREMKEMVQTRQDVASEGESSLDIKVIVVPCVGDDEYAQRQMSSLDISIGGDGSDLPAILRPMRQIKSNGAATKGKGLRRKGYFSFGSPDSAILATYTEMENEHGLFLDLLYGASAWTLILQHWSVSNFSSDSTSVRREDYPIAGRQVMYIHSGGLEGNASQMTRYKHKGLIDPVLTFSRI